VFHRLCASKRRWEPRSQPHGAGIASGNRRLRSIEDAGIPLSRRSLTFLVGSIDSPYVLSARRLRDQNDDCDATAKRVVDLFIVPPFSGTLGGFSASQRQVTCRPATAWLSMLHREIVKAIALPGMKERMTTLGFEPVASTPEECAAQFRTESAKWGKVIREAGIRAP
jgi:hypothetical protein